MSRGIDGNTRLNYEITKYHLNIIASTDILYQKLKVANLTKEGRNWGN